MTAAQKAAKEKFSKAIAYRTKTGVSLKEAFAHVYGKKVGAVKKKAAPKKKTAVKKTALKKKAAPKKKAAVKKVAPVKAAPIKTTVKKYNSVTTVSGVKKAAAKKVTGSHKDTKSHNVNIRVVSGVNKISSELINQLKEANNKLIKWQKGLSVLILKKTNEPVNLKKLTAFDIKTVRNAIREQKIHIRELKKNIK
jgi:hypothetical protein